MALTDKDIVITPNKGSSTDDPKIVFSGADASTAAQNITLKTYPTSNGTLSFEGSAGQLFSITNSLSGTIFSVNDVSGIPSIEVLDTGNIKLAQYSGNISINSSTTPYTLHVPSSNPVTYTDTAKITFATGIKSSTPCIFSDNISHGILLGGDSTRNTAVLIAADNCQGGFDFYALGEGPFRVATLDLNGLSFPNGIYYSNAYIGHATWSNTKLWVDYYGFQCHGSEYHTWNILGIEKMRITNAGVAIGTTSTDTTALRIVPIDTSAVQRALHIGYNGTMSSGVNGSYISFGNTTPSTNQLSRIASYYEGGTYMGSLRFYTNSGTDGASPPERMRITSGGNILIDTTTDNGSKLQVNGSITGNTFTSTIATGTAPFTVSSTTIVSNLNADMLDGSHRDTAYNSFGNGTIPVRHSSGYLFSNYFNCTADTTVTAPSHIAIQTSSDNYIRWQTPAQFKTNISLNNVENTALSTWAGSANITTLGTITTGTWSGSFGAVSGANLTSLTAGNLSGTIPSAVLGNSSLYVGTTAIALNRASTNLALTGISSVTLPGSTSGTVQLIPTAAVGTGTVLTIPATTGTIVTTGDTGTVTSTMIADSTIVNGDISASAAIAISKLAASTISGVSLGNNLNTLTIGTGLSGTSYNGSSAVTIAIDSTVVTLTGSQTLTNKTLTYPVIDNIKWGMSQIATAAGTTTLTSASQMQQRFTGTSTQTVVLPVTSTLSAGTIYLIENVSTGNITVNSSGGNLVWTIIPGTTVEFSCIGTTLTTAADWDAEIYSFASSTGSGSVVMATSPTLTTPNIGAATGTSLSVSGSITSTIATGTAPFTVSSTTAVSNLNADYLDGQHGSYYTTAGNLSGTIPSAVLGNSTHYIGTTAIALNRASASQSLTGISIDGSAGSATTHIVADSRAVATTPQTINQGVVFDFKQNTTEGLSDGGTYFGEMTFRQYGSSTDWSGGLSHQLGFTDNGNVWQRSGSSTTWGSWKKLLDSGNYSTYAAPLSGATFTGDVTAPNFNTTSDKNLKTNIETIQNAISIVKQLNGVSFNWKDSGLKSYGVIAQEIEQILPELISMDNETGIKSVNYIQIIAFLIESIKQQNQIIDSFEDRLNILEKLFNK